jgi:hypothetical protein
MLKYFVAACLIAVPAGAQVSFTDAPPAGQIHPHAPPAPPPEWTTHGAATPGASKLRPNAPAIPIHVPRDPDVRMIARP